MNIILVQIGRCLVSLAFGHNISLPRLAKKPIVPMGISYRGDKEIVVKIGKPYEIEHIWADKFERHKDEFEQIVDFRRWRNKIGALILIPKGTIS